MIERIHRDPSAFVTNWEPVSKFCKLEEYNFARFRYRIFGLEFDRKDDQFLEAWDSVTMWNTLKQK